MFYLTAFYFLIGAYTYLTEDQELRLVAWIKNMSKIGYGKTKKEIPLCVKEILDKSKTTVSKFQNNLPSDSWIYSFLRRYPSVSSRIPQTFGQMRASVTKDTIIKWFDVLDKFIEQELGIKAETFSLIKETKIESITLTNQV